MSFNELLFGFLLPFILFFLLTYSLLRKTQIFKEYTIEFGVSFIIAFLGSYWLYINKLSDVLLASSGMIIAIIFITLFVFSIAFSGYKKVRETYRNEVKDRKNA